ncbi:hypothetical protein [Mesobacillus subterraneus]|nr:hypothetical protein [Mesobacillus subterraneus]
MEVKSFTLEVGAMNYGFHLDDIIGLELLQEMKAIINMGMLTLDRNK